MDNTLSCHVFKCCSLIVFFLLSSSASLGSGSHQPDLSSPWAFGLTKSQLNLASLASSLSASSSLMYLHNGYRTYLVLWCIIINCICQSSSTGSMVAERFLEDQRQRTTALEQLLDQHIQGLRDESRQLLTDTDQYLNSFTWSTATISW